MQLITALKYMKEKLTGLQEVEKSTMTIRYIISNWQNKQI